MTAFTYKYGKSVMSVAFDGTTYVFSLPFEGYVATAVRDIRYSIENSSIERNMERFKVYYGNSHFHSDSDFNQLLSRVKTIISKQENQYVAKCVTFDSERMDCDSKMIISLSINFR